MALTDIAVRTAKPANKAFKLADSGGLFLFVTPSGGRHWRYKYRFGGREKLLTLGPYPLVGLRDAREARDSAKRQLLHGVDPSQAKKDVRRATEAEAVTFRFIAEEYAAKLRREGRAAGTMEKIDWYLSFAYPAFGDRPIQDISAADVLGVLRSVESRGRFETARKLRSTVGSVFRHAIATTRVTADPTSALKGALTRPIVTPRAAVTDPVGFGALMRAIWAYDGAPETTISLKLIALLAPRPGELRPAEWPEFDLAAALWTIPAVRMKGRKTHRVPLSTQAVDLLRTLHSLTGNGRYAFPSVRSQDRCMSENTLNAALRRMGYAQNQATAHGFRASFATLANESGLWHPDAIERALAHVEANNVRRAYTRGEHWEERVRLAQWWADECDRMRATKAAQVAPPASAALPA